MKKEMVCTITGAIGGTIAYFFGGWDQALVTLIIFMAIDYISGLIVPARSAGGRRRWI